MPLARHDISGAELVSAIAGFLLTCLLRGMTLNSDEVNANNDVSTHMPLARHDKSAVIAYLVNLSFYSHASCEA